MDFNFIDLLNLSMWIKIVTLIVIGFYLIFTFVVLTQVRVMGEILHLSHGSTALKIISIINIALSISLFIVAIVIL